MRTEGQFIYEKSLSQKFQYYQILLLCCLVITIGCEKAENLNQIQNKHKGLSMNENGIPKEFAIYKDWNLLRTQKMTFGTFSKTATIESVRVFENTHNIKLPKEFIAQCIMANGGLIDGFILFNTKKCKLHCISEFYALGPPKEDYHFKERYIESILDHPPWVENNHLKNTYLPIAKILESIDESEEKNPMNIEGFLSISKKDNSINFISIDGKIILKLFRDYSEFLDKSVLMYLN